jgi:hypothetical protein
MKIRLPIFVSLMFFLFALSPVNAAEQDAASEEQARQERLQRFNERVQQLQAAEGSGYKSTEKPKTPDEMEAGDHFVFPEPEVPENQN